MLYVPTVVVLALALLWTGGWFFAANRAETVMNAWMEREAANGRTYWIADERPYAMSEIVDTVERLLETEFGQKCMHKRLRLPGLASEVARAADGMLQGLGLYHQKVHVLSEMNKTIACSVERARAELGYRPRIGIDEGLAETGRWYREHGYL